MYLGSEVTMENHKNETNKKSCPTKKLVSSIQDKIRTPVQERSIQTKKQIIDASLKLFSEKGYHNTNTKEISALAGVATGCFYSYFKDKRAVFVEALKIYVSQFDSMVNSYLENSNAISADRKKLLYGLVNCLIDAHNIFIGMHNEMLSMRLEDTEIDRILFEKEKDSIQNTYRQILVWKDMLKVSNIEAASVLVYNTIHRVVDIIVLKQSDVNREHLISEAVDMIYKYLFE